MTRSDQCFAPAEQWLDNNGVHINAHGGGLLFHEDTYYWFGEHKIEGKAGNNAHVGVHAYSSKDLLNWKDEGIALAVSEEPDSPIVKGCTIERPKIIYCPHTSLFVMWFHLELKDQGYSAAMCATATSDSPTGPFSFVDAFRPNAGTWPVNVTAEDKVPGKENFLIRDFEGGQMSRDMTLFVDDDGCAYQITSSEDNSTTHISLLTDDYLRPSGKWSRAFAKRWMEAHAVCKRGGKYWYMASGCTGWAPNEARSAVAENIFGPWTELGNPCIGSNSTNNMGPELTFGGQSTYIQKVMDRDDSYIAMFDIWTPKNPINGRYVWLPMTFESDRFSITWADEWQLS